MAHFAKIENTLVTQIIVIDNSDILDGDGNESEALGIKICQDLLGGTWVQTSYNANFRKNFAGIGYEWRSDLDGFIPKKPYNSWLLNQTTCQWEAPAPYPNDGNDYIWNEETEAWDLYSGGFQEI